MNLSKPPVTVPPRTLSVTGMHCVACRGRVKQALEALDEVERADVDLDAGHAVVHFAGGPVNNEVLVEAVKRAGYQAEPEPKRSAAGRVSELSVTGMSCAACATNVQQALEQVDQDAEYGAAVELVRHRISKMSGDHASITNKLKSFLQRRGFAWDVITRAIKEVCPED